MKTAFVGDSVQKRRTVLWIIVGMTLLVAAAGGGIALRMWHSGKDNSTQQAPTIKLPVAADKAQDVALSGNYTDAHKQLNDALNKPGISNSDKYALYYQQGATYQNESKYQQAIDSFVQAEAIQPTQSLAESIGDAYVQLGNKDQAIVYYKKAIQLIPAADDPVAGADKSALEQKIRDQGGQP